MKRTTSNRTSEQYLIDGIANGNSKILELIYKKYSQRIRTLIEKNNGTVEDARDVFQEAIVIIYKNTKKRDIELTSSFFTYFYGICRRVWWRKLQKDRRSPQLTGMQKGEEVYSYEQKTFLDQEHYQLYLEKLSELEPQKKQVLELYLKGKNMSEIAKIMELKSVGYARMLKFRCKQILLEQIRKDARYHELIA